MANATFEFEHFELGVRQHGVRLNQRVMWSWLSSPSGRRDRPVAVVGPVELNKQSVYRSSVQLSISLLNGKTHPTTA